MPFEKGNNLGGRTPGAKGNKTKQWEALGDAIMGRHTERFNEILDNLDPEKFLNAYLQTLEYFKPKLQRTEHSGEITNKETVVFEIAGQKIPFQAVKEN